MKSATTKDGVGNGNGLTLTASIGLQVYIWLEEYMENYRGQWQKKEAGLE
jgi:hypothetical protein